MLRQIEKWNDEGRDYWKGVIIYSYCEGCCSVKLETLKAGRNASTIQLLENSLAEIYAKEKAVSLLPGDVAAVGVRSITLKQPSTTHAASQLTSNVPGDNAELYQACLKEADLFYKSLMNTRANLFAMAEPNAFKNINSPDDIAARREWALSVANGFKKVSQLYDRADFAKANGVLPEALEAPPADTEDVSDMLVKPTLDNLRKSYNKLKKKEPTAERIALMQEREKRIKSLEQRWRSLK